LYNGLIGAYHYLGYGQGPGEQLKYVIALENRPLGAIGFSAAAWRVACRGRFMAWNDHARQKNLHLLVNNHRFLILPWIKIANLASWILAQVPRRLRQDWQTLYAHDIVLVETLVEKKRFHGACYRAANWIGVGETIGRGRNARTSTTLVADQTSLSLSPRFEFSSTLANDVSTASKKKTLHPEAATLFTK
jgi:hypothetical protein